MKLISSQKYKFTLPYMTSRFAITRVVMDGNKTLKPK